MHMFDICLMGDCDHVLAYLVKKLGWELEGGAETEDPLFIEPNNYLFKGAMLYDTESEPEETTQDEDTTGKDSDSTSDEDSEEETLPAHMPDPATEKKESE